MMRSVLILSLLAVTACETSTTQRGVGFDDGYGQYRTTREAELAGAGGTVAPALVEPGIQAAPGQVITGAELAAAGIGGAPGASTYQGGAALPTAVVPQVPGTSTAISDEQDFAAVSSRQTIQSDAERLAQQRQAYQMIPAEPIPDRPSSTGPNIVAFALSTSNQPGEQIYARSGSNNQSRLQRNCARYTTSDKAQEAFLSNGGPQRDRLGLDPDGDGFACYWDPRPFRTARGG